MTLVGGSEPPRHEPVLIVKRERQWIEGGRSGGACLGCKIALKLAITLKIWVKFPSHCALIQRNPLHLKDCCQICIIYSCGL